MISESWVKAEKHPADSLKAEAHGNNEVSHPHWDWPVGIKSVLGCVAETNKECWLVLSLLMIAAIMNYLITAHHMLLGFYTLPTLFSAYFYGRRHATLTALASALLVGLLAHCNPNLLAETSLANLQGGRWYDFAAWAGTLLVTAYAMGTLHELQKARIGELRQTYHGLLLILRQFLSKDKYTENHCYRVSIYAARIAREMGCKAEQIEDVRAASLLHDIGKLDTSREILYKAAQLTEKEYEGIRKHVDKGAKMLEPVAGPLGRIIPIILAHHDRFDGSGYHPVSGNEIPLEARIIAVADVYDALTSDRPYRKALSPFDVKEAIARGSGKEFDPMVVRAFLAAFHKGSMEVPGLVL